MEFNQLRMFSLVAREGSFTRAAERLNCVQPNVTAWIRRLEEELGVDLFVRKRRGVQLTSAGQTFLTFANQIARLAEDGKRAVQESTMPRGTLSIGSMETTAALRLPSMLVRYRKEFPDVEIVLSTGTTKELIHDVLSGDLDGAFIGDFPNHPKLLQHPVLHEELVIVCGRGVASTATTSELFEKQPVLVFRQGCFYRTKLEQWLSELGILAYRVCELGTLDGILACVTAGMGVTIMPRALIESHSARDLLELKPLPPRIGEVTTAFIRRREARETRAMRVFCDLLGSHFAAQCENKSVQLAHNVALVSRPRNGVARKRAGPLTPERRRNAAG